MHRSIRKTSPGKYMIALKRQKYGALIFHTNIGQLSRSLIPLFQSRDEG